MDEMPEAVLDEAEKNLEEGRQADARNLLAGYLKRQPRSERAWWLMSFAVSEESQKVDCLQRVLALNPTHEDARSRLDSLLNPTEPPEFEAETTGARWEVETPATSDLSIEGEEAVTEDLGDFDTPIGDFWGEEVVEDELPAAEPEDEWQPEIGMEEPEGSALWENETESDIQVESGSGSLWAEERKPVTLSSPYDKTPEEEAKSSAPGPGPGIYKASDRDPSPARQKGGRSNRNLLLLVFLIFVLVAVLACGLLVLGFDFLGLGQLF
jgi:hypothetical protein